jgi:hypothetical protein
VFPLKDIMCYIVANTACKYKSFPLLFALLIVRCMYLGVY